MILPKLFNKRSDGKLQEWSIEVDGDKYRMISGMVDGEKVTSEWTVVAGKNIGRANETSPYAQAAAEAQSKWQKKYDQGYREKPEELDLVDFFEPMLAHKLKDYPVVQFPCYVQPKLDGARCVGRSFGLMSRKNKPWITTPHIETAVKVVIASHPTLILDGELYCDKLSDDFNKIISLIKKGKPTFEDFAESKAHIRYHVYDCKFTDRPELTFSQRHAELVKILEGREFFSLVATYLVNSQEEMDQHYEEFLEAGYEGQMIRQDKPYEDGKRSKYLLKRKEFEDGEFEVEDILEGKGNMAGKAGRIVIKDKGKVGLRGNAAFRTELLANKDKYIGKQVTVRYQGGFTPDGKFRFGVMVAVRDVDFD